MKKLYTGKRILSVVLALCLALSGAVVGFPLTSVAVSANPADFDVEMYIADQYVKPGTVENETVQDWITMSASSSVTQREADFMRNSANFWMSYTAWAALNFGSTISDNFNKKDYWKGLLLSILEKTAAGSTPPQSEIQKTSQLIDRAWADFNKNNGFTRELLGQYPEEGQEFLSYVEGKLTDAVKSKAPSFAQAALQSADTVMGVVDLYSKYQSIYLGYTDEVEMLYSLMYFAPAANEADLKNAISELNTAITEGIDDDDLNAMMLNATLSVATTSFVTIGLDTLLSGTPIMAVLNLLREEANALFSSDAWFDGCTNLLILSPDKPIDNSAKMWYNSRG
jgi:hypothetical protein